MPKLVSAIKRHIYRFRDTITGRYVSREKAESMPPEQTVREDAGYRKDESDGTPQA